MKEKTTVATTVTYNRKGGHLHIKNIIGDIRIIGQSKRTDAIDIDVTADDATHDKITVQVSKGKVSVVSQSIVSANLEIKIPAGISMRLENIGETVTIDETVEVLTIVTDRACKVFTQTLHGLALRVSQGTDINVMRLLGHCDIVADGNAMVKVRDTLVSTLSVKLADVANIEMYGSARFAEVSLKGWASLRINRVDEIINKKTERFSTLDLGWSNRRINKQMSKADKKRHNDLINQARADIVAFVKEFLDVVPSPAVKEA